MTALGAERIVVMGASAGGVEAIPVVLGDLSPSLDAAVVVAMHLHPTSGAHLLDIFQRRSALPVEWARGSRSLERGHVYVVPPRVDLAFEGRWTRVRPAAPERYADGPSSISRVFGAAAGSYGARVIGVLLTGLLSDGARGLVAIRRQGGVVIVQDPDDAAFSDMPRHAIDAVRPDAILPLSEIGAAITAEVERPRRRRTISASR